MPAFSPDFVGAEVVPSAKFWSGRDAAWPISGVVQHYTASQSEKGLIKWMASPECANSAHLFVYRSGHLVQMVRLADRAFHAGEKANSGFWKGKKQPTNVNNFTIGIENCNAGWLLKDGSKFYMPMAQSTGFVKGALYKGPAPEYAPDHNGVSRWWEPYSDALVATNIEVLKRIVDMHPAVTAEGIGFHSDVSPHRKYDPGPLWPHEYVLSEVFGTDAVIPGIIVGVTDVKEDEKEDVGANRGNNMDGENPEWHYDYDAQMSMVDRVREPDDE